MSILQTVSLHSSSTMNLLKIMAQFAIHGIRLNLMSPSCNRYMILSGSRTV